MPPKAGKIKIDLWDSNVSKNGIDESFSNLICQLNFDIKKVSSDQCQQLLMTLFLLLPLLIETVIW